MREQRTEAQVKKKNKQKKNKRRNDHILSQEYTPFKFVCLLYIGGQSVLIFFQNHEEIRTN